MNEYRYEDIDLSKIYKVEFDISITQEMMDGFMTLSGDRNPMHTDPDFAVLGGYCDKLVYGMLIASFYSRLVGMYLPGKYCLLQRIDTHFHLPVYIGEALTVSGFIKKKVETGRTLVISAQVQNQKGKIVNTAKIEVGCLQ